MDIQSAMNDFLEQTLPPAVGRTVGQRIAAARKLRGLKQAELAAALGWDTQSRISNYEVGKRHPTLDDLQRIALALHVDAMWLMLGQGLDKSRNTATPDMVAFTTPAHHVRTCPLLSRDQIDAYMNDPRAVEQIERVLPCPVPHGERTFVYTVEGDAMRNPSDHRSLSAGDAVFVDPDAPLNDGRVVAARVGPDVVLRILHIEGSRRYLAALNPAWPAPLVEADSTVRIYGAAIYKGVAL
jgi:SOS-response transcriptional repressor LexA